MWSEGALLAEPLDWHLLQICTTATMHACRTHRPLHLYRHACNRVGTPASAAQRLDEALRSAGAEGADSVGDVGAVGRMFWAALGRGPSYTPVAVQPNGPVMAKLADLLEAGKLRINVDRVFPLKEARWAFFVSLRCTVQCALLSDICFIVC